MHPTPSTRRQSIQIACLIAFATLPVAVGHDLQSFNPSSQDSAGFQGFTQPFRQIDVSASDSGRIAKTNARRGTRVKKGDVIAVLDTSILEASRRIAKVRSESKARLSALQVEQVLAEKRLSKLSDLLESGAGNVEEVSRAEADASVARLNVEAAREELELNRLQLAEIEAQIAQRSVRSPIDGIVTELIIEEGEYVSLTAPHVATIVALEKLRATFFVPTRLAAQVNLEQELTVILPDCDATAIGKVEYIGAVTEADSGRVRLDIMIDNRNGVLRSGVRCVLAFE